MLGITKMNLKLVIRHVHKQLQCGLGCAKNHNKTWAHGVLKERETWLLQTVGMTVSCEYRLVEIFFWQLTLIAFFRWD